MRDSEAVSNAIQRPGKITLQVRRNGVLRTLTPETPKRSRTGGATSA